MIIIIIIIIIIISELEIKDNNRYILVVKRLGWGGDYWGAGEEGERGERGERSERGVGGGVVERERGGEMNKTIVALGLIGGFCLVWMCVFANTHVKGIKIEFKKSK